MGHSERRDGHDEDDTVVASKAAAAFRHGLVPIVCVGEGLEVRQAYEHVAHVLAQVEGSLAGITPEQAASVVVAYEPVWAIGTGEVATPEDAQEVCEAIRGKLGELYSPEVADGVRVLYGGSVKSGNIASIMAAWRRRRGARRRRLPPARGVRGHLPLPAAPHRLSVSAAPGARVDRATGVS